MSIEEAGISGFPRVSVVIPTYGRPDRVRLALGSLFEQTLSPDQYELIVIDSSPNDEVLAVVEEMEKTAPFALTCYSKKAEGPGPSRNLGAHRARGEFIAFLDSDCIATPRWLEEGLAMFDEGVGIVLGRTIPEAGVKRSVFSHYVLVESEGFIYECANIFYRRRAFEEGGGFHHDLHPHADRPMGGEDVALAWQVKRLGWESHFAPKALVYHEVRPIPVYRWIVIKHLFIWPYLVAKFPELRRFFFCRYFFDRGQAALLAGFAGLALFPLTPWAVLLWLPYLLVRASEPTATLKGALRLLRPFFYLLRDLVSLALLLAGSIRFRTVLL